MESQLQSNLATLMRLRQEESKVVFIKNVPTPSKSSSSSSTSSSTLGHHALALTSSSHHLALSSSSSSSSSMSSLSSSSSASSISSSSSSHHVHPSPSTSSSSSSMIGGLSSQTLGMLQHIQQSQGNHHNTGNINLKSEILGMGIWNETLNGTLANDLMMRSNMHES